jgi:glycosyltransferase involved in cell wall biosynthesis
MSHSIALAMILGDLDEEGHEKFKNCIESFEPYVDRIFINYNGKGEYPLWLYEIPYVNIEKFKWEDDFSLARNQSFEMVPKDEHDWIMWADSDDTLAEGDKLQELLDSLDSETQGVFLKYDYAIDADTDNVIIEQWRERIFRTDCQVRWKYPIHETADTPPGTQYARRDEVWLRHHRTKGIDDVVSRQRNRRIIVKAMKKWPDEPRFHLYFANEVLAEAAYTDDSVNRAELYQVAVDSYEKYIKLNPPHDDVYAAVCRLSEAYFGLGEYEKSIDFALQALKLFTTWPDAYLRISQAYMALGEFQKCRDWAELCLKYSEKPTTTQAIESRNQDFTPHLLMGIANEELGFVEPAIENYETALQFHHPDTLEERLDNLKKKIEQGIPKEPDFKELRKKTFNSNTGKSIAFVVPPLWEPWHPDVVSKTGIGGAETCVIEVAKRFALEGWRTVVFGTPGPGRGTDTYGIEWWDVTKDYVPTEQFTVVVSSRAPQVFDAPIEAEAKFLWVHDVNIGEDGIHGEWGDRSNDIDKIIVLTEWHKQHMMRLYDLPEDKFWIIHNGIDLQRFNRPPRKRIANRYVYSSSFDRGLDSLIDMWPEIRKSVDKAELNIFYGWDSIDQIIDSQSSNWQYLKFFRDELQRKIKDTQKRVGGIRFQGRKDQKTLAKEFLTCDAWLYPTFFLETFCITAIETQAAGVIPVTSELGALSEVVGGRFHTHEGFPNNYTYQKEFVEQVQGWAGTPETEKAEFREYAKQFASQFTWDNAFEQWQQAIAHTTGNVLELVER